MELIVAIAIIGLLSSMTVFTYQNQQLRARETRRISDIATVNSALQTYMAAGNDAPDTGASWNVISNSTALKTSLVNNGYLSVLPKEPNPDAAGCLYYFYEAPSDTASEALLIDGVTPMGKREYLLSFFSEMVEHTGSHPLNNNLKVPRATAGTCAAYYQVFLIPTTR